MMPKDENGKIQTGDTDYVDTYKAMEKCLKSGKTKAISTSNLSEAKLERLLKETSVVNEVSRRNTHHVLHCTAWSGLTEEALIANLRPAQNGIFSNS